MSKYRVLTNNQIKEVIQLYADGLTCTQLAKKYGVSYQMINSYLKQNNISKRSTGGISVRCVETNQVYNSLSQASIKHSIGKIGIRLVCEGKLSTCGGFHWEFVNAEKVIPHDEYRKVSN